MKNSRGHGNDTSVFQRFLLSSTEVFYPEKQEVYSMFSLSVSCVTFSPNFPGKRHDFFSIQKVCLVSKNES